MTASFPISFQLAQFWLRFILRCDNWNYRIAFDDVDHKGKEIHVFEGVVWAKDEDHAIRIQTRLTQLLSGRLHLSQHTNTSKENWLGFRHGAESKTGFWWARSAVGLRSLSHSLHKGWGPGGLKPGQLSGLVFNTLSNQVSNKVEMAEQTMTQEQVIVRLVLMFILCLLVLFGALGVFIVHLIQGITMSWGVIYAGVFVVISFGLMSVIFAQQLQEKMQTKDQEDE